MKRIKSTIKRADPVYISGIERTAWRGDYKLMKMPKILFIAISLIILTLFTVFPAKSEATNYSLVQVYNPAAGVFVDGFLYPFAYFGGVVNLPGNNIGTLSFYNSDPVPFLVLAHAS